MRARRLCLLILLVGSTLLCRCASLPAHPKNPWAALAARYVSWEPTTTFVPAVNERRVAREYLQTSLSLWKEAAYSSYIYVRARQLEERSVELTAFQVTDGRVTQRTLVRLDPTELASSQLNNRVHRTSVWHETERSLGTHPGGFPLATLDELYERCRRDVLAAHPELPVRMHFDMSGFLQHCGFAAEDCDDCAAVSIQAVGKYEFRPTWDLRRNLCADFDGLAPVRTTPIWNGGCSVCRCETGAEPPKPRPAPPSRDITDLGDICNINPTACPNGEPPPNGDGLEDIGEIDPKACPNRDPHLLDGSWGMWGNWSCPTLLMADCPVGVMPPDVRAPICVGKATPTESYKIAQDRCKRTEALAWRR